MGLNGLLSSEPAHLPAEARCDDCKTTCARRIDKQGPILGIATGGDGGPKDEDRGKELDPHAAALSNFSTPAAAMSACKASGAQS